MLARPSLPSDGRTPEYICTARTPHLAYPPDHMASRFTHMILCQQTHDPLRIARGRNDYRRQEGRSYFGLWQVTCTSSRRHWGQALPMAATALRAPPPALSAQVTLGPDQNVMTGETTSFLWSITH